MPDPFGASNFMGHRRDPFSDDGFGFGGFGDMAHAFSGMGRQMERMHESFDQPFPSMAPGGEGHS